MKAYLDIETDRRGQLSVVGIFFQNGEWVQLYGKSVTTENIWKALKKASTIVTFNGDRFDLPSIKKELNLDLKSTHVSIDLLNEKRGLGIKGGLKQLEKMFGIRRKTEGLNGYHAILLWESYINKGDSDALDLLLQYNKEDVVNLMELEKRLNQLKGESCQ